jgi:hypothetical protein
MTTPYKLNFPDVTDPNFDPDVPFEADNGLNYKWNGNAWEVICGAGTETDGFLLKHGHIVDDAPAMVEYEWNQDVRITIKDDNFWTFKNSGDFVQLEGLDDDNISLNAELANVDIHSSSVQVVAVNQAKLTSESSDVTLEGASDQAEKVNRTIDASSPDEQIANKRYVDETAAFLQGEVVELEQEIEGIAITSERGEWISATSVNAGEFRMVNLGGQNTQDYNDETVVSIIFNNFDAQDPSVEHGWADVEIGNILELLDKPDSDYAIYEITGINPGGGTMGFDVAFIKGVGEATLGDRARIKIFAKPTGGNLEDYVRIGGDTMTGALTIDVAQPQNNPANSFRIWGMIKPDAASPPERSLLLKDFRREQGSDSDDYIAYYGSGGGDSGLVNLGMLSEYLKKVDLGISRTTTAVTVTNTAGTNAQINGATTSVAGVVTTSEQTWSGQKHFNGVVDFKNKIKVNGSTTNNRYLGTDGSGNTTWKTVSTASNYVRTETADYNASIKIYRSGSSYYITGGAS